MNYKSYKKALIVQLFNRLEKQYSDCGAIMALDIALKRNETDWFEKLPPELDELVEAKETAIKSPI